MKSILTIFGTFLFSIFVEGFIRIIIVFYHQGVFSFFGISSLPSNSWVVILLIALLVIYWLCGMLTVTITESSPKKHLIALWVLISLFRINEIVHFYSIEPTWYLITIFFIPLLSLSLSYITKIKSNAYSFS